MVELGICTKKVWTLVLYTYKNPRENMPAIDHFRFEVICKVLNTNIGRQTMAMSKDILITAMEIWNTG